MNARSSYGKKKTVSADTLNNLLDNITGRGFASADVYILPTGDDSEGDSDKSDTEGNDNLADHLTRKILNAPAEATIDEGANGVSSDEDDQNSAETNVSDEGTARKNRKVCKPVGKWRKGDLKPQPDSDVNYTGNHGVNTGKTATDLFEMFWPNDFLEYVKRQSELYAKQCNATSRFEATVDELKLFLAVLMISGYSSLPRRDMYWSLDGDIKNEAVAHSMPRNRFREILKNLHFADNTSLAADDKFAKVRPLITHLNAKFISLLPSDVRHVDVDESMIPYYSHHGCKQRIQGKPIRYGFKFWSLNACSGYLISTEPYQGKGTMLSHIEHGLGSSVVLTFAHKLAENYSGRRFCFYIDNFFTGLPLLREMSALNFGCTGTIRSNRVENCPVVSRQFEKERRGSINSYINNDKSKLIVVQWKDNAVVRMASNTHGVSPTRSARRWSTADKKHITVDMPYSINMYNSFMGGTDQMDRNVAQYRVKIRNNKWWWQVFTHLLSASLSNAWILYRTQVTRDTIDEADEGNDNFVCQQLPKLDFLGFIRDIVATYLLLSNERQNLGRPSASSSQSVLVRNVPESVRFSTHVQHYPSSMKQGRCRVCKKNTTFGCGVCRMNIHPLQCYKEYHKPCPK